MRRLASIAMVLAFVGAACSSPPPVATAVGDVADTYLQSAYADLAEATSTLAASVGALCAEASTTSDPTNARAAWRDAQLAWKRSRAGWFGPTTMDRAESLIGYEPTSPSGIESTIASVPDVDAGYIAESVSSTFRGLGAAEYLLFSPTALDEQRCHYLVAVVDTIDGAATELRTAWLESWADGPAYLDRFRGDAQPAMAPRDAVGDVVAAVADQTKLLTLDRLGRALGITRPEADPTALADGAAGMGLAALRAEIEGIAAAYGTDPHGISGAVAARDADLDTMIHDDLDGALTTIDEIVGATGAESLDGALLTHADEFRVLYEHLASLRRAFEADIVSVLDITLGFSDTDGDTG